MSDLQRTLPCGRSVSWLLELAADGVDEPPDPDARDHLAHCPHCRAELVALRRRWVPVWVAAARPVRIPPGLAGRALSSVRAVRGGLIGRHGEMRQPGGLLRVAEPAMLMLARRLAREVVEALPGIRFRGLSGGVDGLQVRLAVPYGAVLTDVSARVRRDLQRELDVALGVAAPAVDVLVEDVLAPGRQH